MRQALCAEVYEYAYMCACSLFAPPSTETIILFSFEGEGLSEIYDS